MHRVINPLLFLLANMPDAEKNLDMLMSMLQATADSVKNIKNGIENFQATMMMSQNPPGPQPAQTTEPAAKPDSSSEPDPAPGPDPASQADKPPVS